MSEKTTRHGSAKTYIIGFILSVILTAIPFVLIMSHIIKESRISALVIILFALVQVVVHMICFLHMNFSSERGWTMMALIFTIILVVIMFSGSIWVMYHLNHNMMVDMMNMP